jgi:hypothetical protein
MHFLRFAAFLIAAVLLVPAASAQTSQPQLPQSQYHPSWSQTSQPEIPHFQHQSRHALPDHPVFPLSGNLDRGIYLGAAGNICGSIVSYNFSPGESPQLESITTCTPANRVTSKRARGRLPQPQSHRVFLMGVAEQSR